MSERDVKAAFQTIEWLTVFLWLGCLGAWALCLFILPGFIAPAVLIFVLVLQSSLSHEALHGHPFPKQWANDAIALFSLGIFIPYIRFRDTHLAHHIDEHLTDPYDDPESNYYDPEIWAKISKWKRNILRINNTLLGRMLIGPLISQISFMRGDWREICAGHHRITLAWALHFLTSLIILSVVSSSAISILSYLICCYLAISILKIRTFLEHRAHQDPIGRTVIIEDTGPLSFLFLNNNLHVVHHMHPKVPWYALPKLYRQNSQEYNAYNDNYNYTSYAQIFRKYLLKTKDPVPHPLWPFE